LDFETLFAQQEAEMQAANQNGVDLANQPDYDINALLLQAESQVACQNDFSLPNPAQETTAEATNQPDVEINALSQQAEAQVGNQDYIDLTTEQPGTASAEQIPFPQLPSLEDQIDQLLNARAQEFFSTNVRVQAQLPSLHETMSAKVDSADPSQAETPTGRKKAQPRKRKTAAKANSGNGTAPQSIQSQMPDQAQQQVTTQQNMMAQMPVPSFGLDQVMASDPFVSSSPQQGTSHSGQAMFNPSLPGVAQMPSDLVHTPGQQTAQQFSSHTAFMNSASNTPPQGFLSALMSSPSAQASGQLTATPSSDNKRKASAAHTMESPTKRRQSMNQQGAVVAVAQSSPPLLPVGVQNSQTTPPMRIQMSAPDLNTPPSSLGTPAQNFQTPVDTAFNFGVSPPSGSTTSFGTAARAGITAVIKSVIHEAKRRGTALGQMLADGFQANFAGPECGARIKHLTKTCMADVDAINLDDENHAFSCGAWKALHQIMQEMEHHGAVLGNALLVGPLSGPGLVAVRQKMGDLFNEVAESYKSPPRFDASSAQLAQPAQIQPTPTLAPHAATHLSQQTNVSNTSMHQQLQRLEQLQRDRDQQLQQMMLEQQQLRQQMVLQQQQQQQTKKPATPRKPRARKSSVAVSTPVTDGAARDTPSPTQGSVAGSPRNSARTSKNSNNGQSAPGQYVPRIAYHFSDGTFYMQVGANNTGTGEASYRKIGTGTVAAQTALRQFLSDAQAKGAGSIPFSFVLRLWLTTEQNLENLRRVLMGEGELFF
jgi:hypothetical protein